MRIRTEHQRGGPGAEAQRIILVSDYSYRLSPAQGVRGEKVLSSGYKKVAKQEGAKGRERCAK